MNHRDDDEVDRVRRRLLKHAVYVPPMIISLHAERARAGRAAPTAAVNTKAQAGINAAASAHAKVQAKIA